MSGIHLQKMAKFYKTIKKCYSVSRGILAQQPFRGILTHCRLKKNYGTKQNFENGSRKPHYYTLK